MGVAFITDGIIPGTGYALGGFPQVRVPTFRAPDSGIKLCAIIIAPRRLMLTVLGGLAEFERELIRARTGEGRIRAKARGVKFGRPRKLTSHQRQEALHRLHAGETMTDVARTYAVDPATISRLAAHSPFEHGAAGL